LGIGEITEISPRDLVIILQFELPEIVCQSCGVPF
jgi:hypothetical protein